MGRETTLMKAARLTASHVPFLSSRLSTRRVEPVGISKWQTRYTKLIDNNSAGWLHAREHRLEIRTPSNNTTLTLPLSMNIQLT